MIKVDKKTKTISTNTDNLNLINRELKAEGIKGILTVDENGFKLKSQWTIQTKGNN